VAWNTRKCRCNEFARVQRPEEFFSDRVWLVLDNIDISQSYLVCPTFLGKKTNKINKQTTVNLVFLSLETLFDTVLTDIRLVTYKGNVSNQ
jgi:hypothetical protein